MRKLMIVAFMCAAPQTASAGDIWKSTEGLEYRFVKCAAPVEPDMSVDPKLVGAKARAAANARIKAYNAYIDGVNAYVECLAAEAKADLEAYYAAVSEELDARQEEISARADAARPTRSGAPRR